MKRDVLGEGSAISRLSHPRRVDPGEVTGCFAANGGDVKSKGKTLSLAGGDGGVMAVFSVKRLQS